MGKRMMVLMSFGLLLPAAGLAQQPPPEPLFAAHLFPPELVMQHQAALRLTDAQRTTITNAIKELQAAVVDLQWRMEAENQRLAELLRDSVVVDAPAVLAQLDRLLEIERDVKRAHFGLMIRIKNALTGQQQAMLHDHRARAALRH